LDGKVPALALLNPGGKFAGGGSESSVELVGVSAEPDDESPLLIVRNAGGRYLAVEDILSSVTMSRALQVQIGVWVTEVNWCEKNDVDGEQESTYRFAKSEEGAGGGVLPEADLRYASGVADRELFMESKWVEIKDY
jgi:hypothetical protein